MTPATFSTQRATSSGPSKLLHLAGARIPPPPITTWPPRSKKSTPPRNTTRDNSPQNRLPLSPRPCGSPAIQILRTRTGVSHLHISWPLAARSAITDAAYGDIHTPALHWRDTACCCLCCL